MNLTLRAFLFLLVLGSVADFSLTASTSSTFIQE